MNTGLLLNVLIESCLAFGKGSTCFFFFWFRLAKHLFLVIMNDLILLSDLQYLRLIRAGEGWKLTPQSGILTKRSMTLILSRKELNTSLLESCYSKAHSRKFFENTYNFLMFSVVFKNGIMFGCLSSFFPFEHRFCECHT